MALDEDLAPAATAPGATGGIRTRLSPPAVVAAACVVGLCILVLTRSTQLVEPDDLAYRASILALEHGHLWLTNAQYAALAHQLSGSSAGGLGGIAQWVHRADGTWISEKNPGYPFYAVGFARLGLLRLAPLFYGGFAAVALYLGGKRWLGRWGGASAVALFCSSGAAMVFAWRATMPSFTDAAMVAAGCGLLLWTVLAAQYTARRRILVGLLAFFAFDSAMFIRYTNVVAVLCAAGVVALLAVFARGTLPRRASATWLASQVAFAGLFGTRRRSLRPSLLDRLRRRRDHLQPGRDVGEPPGDAAQPPRDRAHARAGGSGPRLDDPARSAGPPQHRTRGGPAGSVGRHGPGLGVARRVRALSLL
jgi:hypothetical protein